MKRRSPYDYMGCIKDLLYLQGLKLDEPIQGNPDVGEPRVIEHIERLFEYLESSGMKSTIDSEPCNYLRAIEQSLREQTAKDSAACITSEDVKRIRRFASSMETLLLSESNLIQVYEVGESDISLDTDMLLNGIARLFDPGVFDSLPGLVVESFKEAGKALAFQLPMASAALSFRGCEALFRAYYSLSGVEGSPFRPFRPLLNDLNDLWPYKKRFSETIDYIDNLIRIRNRVVHPTRYYNVRQSQALLLQCVNACNRMIDDLVELDIDKFKQNGKDPREYLEIAREEVRKAMRSDELQEKLFQWIRMEPEVEVVDIATD